MLCMYVCIYVCMYVCMNAAINLVPYIIEHRSLNAMLGQVRLGVGSVTNNCISKHKSDVLTERKENLKFKWLIRK